MYSSEYNALLERLNTFIAKYHKNEIRRGLLLFLLIFGLSTLTVFLLEYVEHFTLTVRTVLFYACLTLYSAIFLRFILYPAMALFNIRNGLSHKQAAEIISKHFPEIQDKFNNTLELAELVTQNRYSASLIMASIDQRAKLLQPIPFHLAIDFRFNYKLLKYLALVILVYLSVLIYKPIIIKEGSERILHHRTHYVAPAPFMFILENKNLTVSQGEDFEIKVKTQGQYVPQKVYVVIGSTRLLLSNTDKSTFTYSFKGVNRSFDFRFEAEEVVSSSYRLNVVFPPQIISFKIEIIPPAYTGLSSTIAENTGDITIPCGSQVKWLFATSHTDSLWMSINDSSKIPSQHENDMFVIKQRFFNSANYTLFPSNKEMVNRNNMTYAVNVIPDIYPSIQADFVTDSTMWGMYYFKGSVNDDYGFKKLLFTLKFGKDSVRTISIPIQNNLLNQEFYFAYDFSSLKNVNGNIEYYFEVWDNDGIHGSKSTKSEVKNIRIPDKKEIEQYKNEANKNIFEQLHQSEKITSDLEKELKQLQKNITNSNNLSWEHTQKFQQILEKQLSLEQALKKIAEQNKQKNNLINTFTEQDKEMLEKQKQIQELIENIMDDELKKLIDQLKEMMKNLDKSKLNEMTQELKMQTEDVNKELDRTLELLKKMNVEEKINNVIKDLDKLAQEQENLSEQSENKKTPSDSLRNMQQQQQQDFKDLQQKYQDLMKENNQLQEPFNMQNFNEEQQQIEQEFQQGQEELQKNNRKGASKHQKNNANKLKELSEQMQKMMQQNQEEANAEDEESLKMTLENIKNLSFAQEDLLLQTKQAKPYDPKYPQLSEKQNRLQGNVKVIEDSLEALAKRNPMIKPTIKKHLKNIKGYNRQTLKALEERNVVKAATNQQLLMTEANELALLMGEILKEMQKANSQKMCSGGQCKKPGNGKPKPSYQQMKSMQQQIKQQLQSILNEMKQGQKNGDGKKMSEQLGKMISMQDKMNQMLNELMQQGGISPESAKKLQEIKNLMNDVQKDIANKNISNQTIQRQEQILTRLLEAEKADNERDTENKRESQTGKNDKISNPNDFFQYKGKKSTYDEILFQSNLPLKKYYQELYRKYMINLNK
ncbi:MAG TPA: hypothetical protein PLP65_01730 [Bacteroidales bacterium]|nr:hypothetical protein [Bacteroidales bacterium]